MNGLNSSMGGKEAGNQSESDRTVEITQWERQRKKMS